MIGDFTGIFSSNILVNRCGQVNLTILFTDGITWAFSRTKTVLYYFPDCLCFGQKRLISLHHKNGWNIHLLVFRDKFNVMPCHCRFLNKFRSVLKQTPKRNRRKFSYFQPLPFLSSLRMLWLGGRVVVWLWSNGSRLSGHVNGNGRKSLLHNKIILRRKDR